MGSEIASTVIPQGRSGLTMRQGWGWGLLLVWLSMPTFAAESVSRNPYLQKAFQFFDAFEYEQALSILDKAEQWPSNTVEDKVSIALLEGILSHETQQPMRGDRAFQRALELDRTARVSVIVSPKVAARLEELRAQLSLERPAPPSPHVSAPPPMVTPVPESARRTSLKLPVVVGGGVVAVGGMLAWGRAKSLEGKVRRADRSITTQAHLDNTLQRGRTFEKVGWVLMGLGTATTVGGLLFLGNSDDGVKAAIAPVEQGAQLSVFWSLP
jgi:hypothetical protein